MIRWSSVARVLVLFAAVLSFAAVARADGFTVTLLEVGPDVVATGSGAINLTGLTFLRSLSPCEPVIGSGFGQIILGAGIIDCDEYLTISGPLSFGSGFNHFASSGTGSLVGVTRADGSLKVPSGYTSETPLAATATWNNSSFASLDVTPGTYVWTWGTGDVDQKFTLQIGPSAAVPEPSGILLFASGALAMIGIVRSKVRD